MQVDPTGLLIACVVCAALGFLIGWMGGVVEGRQRERMRRDHYTHADVARAFTDGYELGLRQQDRPAGVGEVDGAFSCGKSPMVSREGGK